MPSTPLPRRRPAARPTERTATSAPRWRCAARAAGPAARAASCSALPTATRANGNVVPARSFVRQRGSQIQRWIGFRIVPADRDEVGPGAGRRRRRAGAIASTQGNVRSEPRLGCAAPVRWFRRTQRLPAAPSSWLRGMALHHIHLSRISISSESWPARRMRPRACHAPSLHTPPGMSCSSARWKTAAHLHVRAGLETKMWVLIDPGQQTPCCPGGSAAPELGGS